MDQSPGEESTKKRILSCSRATGREFHEADSTTLAKKIETGTLANYRRVHAREITHLCPLVRGCPNFFGQGSRKALDTYSIHEP